MKKVIITGPTGAVGVSLINELLENGYEVTAVCRRNSQRISSIPVSDKVKIIECNQNELHTLASKFNHSYEYFYHFAWDGTYGDTRQNINLQMDNIKCTLDAVELARVLNCKVFIGAGSQSEFGHIDGVLRPFMPCNPDNGYGIAKLAAGQLSRILCRQYGIRHEWCRIISLYGPYDGAYTLVMSTIIKLLKKERLDFTKGDQIWDYIYSKDAAKAFRLVAERGKDGSIYCFGSGKPRRLKEFITVIRDNIDKDAVLNFGALEYYPNQVMHLEPDISNLVMDTGFNPNYSFEEGIKETIDWVKRSWI